MTMKCYQSHESFARTGQNTRIAAGDFPAAVQDDVCNVRQLNKLTALHRGGALGTTIASLKLPLAGIYGSGTSR
jgi:hypothetical protein